MIFQLPCTIKKNKSLRKTCKFHVSTIVYCRKNIKCKQNLVCKLNEIMEWLEMEDHHRIINSLCRRDKVVCPLYNFSRKMRVVLRKPLKTTDYGLN